MGKTLTIKELCDCVEKCNTKIKRVLISKRFSFEPEDAHLTFVFCEKTDGNLATWLYNAETNELSAEHPFNKLDFDACFLDFLNRTE